MNAIVLSINGKWVLILIRLDDALRTQTFIYTNIRNLFQISVIIELNGMNCLAFSQILVF